MIIIYHLILLTYIALLHLAAPFHRKARLFVCGRWRQWHRLRSELSAKCNGSPILHFHCASTGEFEQGRPVIEELKRQRPDVQILLTFFSPSGFNACHNYAYADYVFYLPIDFCWNARRFVRIVKPTISIFVKYEYWRCHIGTLKKSGAKCYLVSAIFRPQQVFFSFVTGKFFQKILRDFDAIFVQNQCSAELLQPLKLQCVILSGDTRFDRVAVIAQRPKPLPLLEKWAQQNSEILVAGSTWQPDEELLAALANSDTDLRIIFVPHELHENRINRLMQTLKKPSVRYSQIVEKQNVNMTDYQYIIIDCMGILSSVYKLARYAYIGGGFGAGIHNTLEAAVYGMPVFFGTNYEKFQEAKDLIDLGGAFFVKNLLPLQNYLRELRNTPQQWEHCCTACKNYVQQNMGATQKICNLIIKNKI